MSETSVITEPQSQPEPETESQEPEETPCNPTLQAVRDCNDAYDEAYNAAVQRQGGLQKAKHYLCKEEAISAYCLAMPVLSTRRNILAFMACVAEGVLRERIPNHSGGKLIYAAQAALGALPRRPKPRKKAQRKLTLLPTGVATKLIGVDRHQTA